MIRKDCFGHVPGKKDCQVMTENICEKRKCSFFKTKKEFLAGLDGASRMQPPYAPRVESAGEQEIVSNIRSCALRVKRRRGKAVRCLDTGDVFFSASAAAEAFGCRPDEVSRACRGEVKTARGFRFAYLEEDD